MNLITLSPFLFSKMLSGKEWIRLENLNQEMRETVRQRITKVAEYISPNNTPNQEIDRTITQTVNKKNYKTLIETGFPLDYFHFRASLKQEATLRNISDYQLEPPFPSKLTNFCIDLAKQGFIYEASEALKKIAEQPIPQDSSNTKSSNFQLALKTILQQLIESNQLKEAIQLIQNYKEGFPNNLSVDLATLISIDLATLIREKPYSFAHVMKTIESAPPLLRISESNFSTEEQIEDSLASTNRVNLLIHMLNPPLSPSENIIQALLGLKNSSLAQILLIGNPTMNTEPIKEKLRDIDPLYIDFTNAINNKTDLESNTTRPPLPVHNQRLKETILAMENLPSKQSTMSGRIASITTTIDRVISALESNKKEGDETIIRSLRTLKFS